VGTGFFVWHMNRVWLVTAAHIPLYQQPKPNWEKWPEVLFVRTPGRKHDFALPLLKPGSKEPNFAYIAGPSGLADFLAIPVPIEHFAKGRPLAGVERFKLDGVPIPKVGTTGTAIGYKTIGSTFIKTTFEAAVTSADQWVVRLSKPSSPGISGGPLLGGDGTLMGLVFGNTGVGVSGEGMAVSPHSMREIIDAGIKTGL
jgi:hypothetical protein